MSDDTQATALKHAERQAFKNGWEAAKLGGFLALAQGDQLSKRAFIILPEVARLIHPLVKARFEKLTEPMSGALLGDWMIATSVYSPFDPTDVETPE